MSSTEQNKPAKSAKRSRKASKKADTQTPAEIQPIEQVVAAEMQSPDPEQHTLVQPEPVPEQATVLTPPANSLSSPAQTTDVAPAPVSLQTIANAYRDYTRKSFAEIGSYFEQLGGVRSLDKAVALQTEFVKRAYETSVAETQKLCELHNRLARQTLQPFQALTNKAETRDKS